MKTMELGNALNWFEIPVTDFDRAKKFYEVIFNYQMPENTMGPARMGFFLHDTNAGKVGGAIVHNPSFYSPSDNGSLIYLNCQPDLQVVLDKVTDAGGTVLTNKTEVAPGLGYWALIKDTEGNRVALHSMG
jgi:predicted enzyme related to lactoylglutathione lyase